MIAATQILVKLFSSRRSKQQVLALGGGSLSLKCQNKTPLKVWLPYDYRHISY